MRPTCRLCPLVLKRAVLGHFNSIKSNISLICNEHIQKYLKQYLSLGW